MNKSNINMENVLPKLPDGFDTGRIVMPERVRRGKASTLRLYRRDFDTIERSGFKGFFAVANKMCICGRGASRNAPRPSSTTAETCSL